MTRTKKPADIVLALTVSARLVERHGDDFIPYFEAMEKQVADLRRRDETIARAKKISAAVQKVGLNPGALMDMIGERGVQQ